MSRGSKIFAVVLVAMVAAAIWGLSSGLERIAGGVLPDPVEPGLPVDFEIAPGQSATIVASNLDDQGVVGANDFIDEVNRRDIAETIAPGNYELETGMDVVSVVDVIEAGPSLLRITVAEGLRIDQTLTRLAEQTSFEAIEFADVLDAQRNDPEGGPLVMPEWVPPLDELPDSNQAFEGLLFPLTYDFELDAEPTEILQRLIDQTGQTMDAVPPEQVTAAAEDDVDRYDALIIASMIEREAQVSEDRPLIASVIRNRLDIPMRLQIDATNEYARAMEGEAEGSAWNTYEIDALPPTPIAGARAQAIQVAFNPAETDFTFYVLDDACDGTHVFAESAEEHEENVAAYREAGECADA
nr:endolytic transglycosylase MltG [Salsipaludibacter albus]